MCRTAVSSVDDPFSKGLNAGILFLLAMPFTLAGSVGGVLWLAHRARRRTGEAREPD